MTFITFLWKKKVLLLELVREYDNGCHCDIGVGLMPT